MSVNNLDNIKFWTSSTVLCIECDGRGFWFNHSGQSVMCENCAHTGREPIPWAELFPRIREESR